MDVREPYFLFFFFFFNDTATTEIYTLSLHDALPIFDGGDQRATSAVIVVHHLEIPGNALTGCDTAGDSELQHQGSHFVTVTVVPPPALETMSNSSMRRRTPGNPRPRPPELE